MTTRIPDWTTQLAWAICGVFATGAVWYFLSMQEIRNAGLSAVAAIVFAGLAIALHRRRDKGNRPDLMTSVGYAYLVASKLKRIPRERVSSVIYGVEVRKSGAAFVMLPFVVENTSDQALTELEIRLQYPEEFAVPDLTFVDCEAVGMRFHKVPRDIRIHAGHAYVALSHSVLRPGEKIVLMDILRFANAKRSATRFMHSGSLYQQEMAKRLVGIPDFGDFFFTDVNVLCKELPPTSQGINVFWYQTSNLSALVERARATVAGLWAGEYPRTGFYLKYFWEKPFFNREAIDVYVPDIRWVKSRLDQPVAFEIAEREHARIFLAMPAWNYWEEPARIDVHAQHSPGLTRLGRLFRR